MVQKHWGVPVTSPRHSFSPPSEHSVDFEKKYEDIVNCMRPLQLRSSLSNNSDGLKEGCFARPGEELKANTGGSPFTPDRRNHSEQAPSAVTTTATVL